MASEKDVEDQLFESGNKLVVPPSSVDELLPLLDSVEKCLLNVEQSPGESMQTALAPSLKALVDDKLLRHSDVDVKVAVASCISEITRITAPEAPYDDDRMKEVFQLIVSSFENLSDNKSRSYAKRTSILQTVAKVRSCVVMLDLECDALIVEMFQHFLDSIRDHHPENVITAMETIMTLVLEESEDISMELLSPILACVKNDSKEVLPIARGLGKKVLLNCAEKVKPYLVQAVKALDSSVTDYDEFVANICQGVDGDAEQTKVQADEIMADEGEPVKLSSDMEAQDNEEVAKEAASEKVDPSGDRSPQSALSNGVVAQTGESTLEGSSPVQKQEDEHPTENTNDLAAENVDSLNPGELANTDEEVAVTLEKEETTSSPVKSSDSPFASNEKKLEGIPDGEGQTEDIPSPHHAVPSAAPVEKEENSDVKGSPSKTSEPPSVSPARNTSDEILEKAEPCEKDSSGKEASRSLDDSKKVADAASDPGAKPDAADAQKKMPAASSAKTKASEDVDVPMKDSETTIVPTVKPSRYARKKVLACDSDEVKASDEVDIAMKDSEDISDSEVKHSTRSRKKFATGSSGEIKASAEVDVPMKDSEDTSDLEVKHSRRSRKKVAACNSAEIKASADGDIPMKDSDSEVKHGRHARKKAAALRSGDIKASAEVDAHMKDNEATSDSEAKPLKQSVKKVDGGSKKKAPMKDDEATSDSEEKPLKQSVKKIDGGSKKNAPMKDSEATSDSEEKPLKKSVKKVDGGGKKNASVKESEAISDSEEKSLKQSVKKGDGSSKKNVKAISSKQEDKKTSARRKSVGEKDTKKAPAKDNTKDTITSPKSSGKPIKDEDNVKETPMTDPKRKRTPGKEKEPAKDFGESLVDSKIRVYWPEDKKYYDGTIVSFDSKKKKHTVLYNDGDEETLNLRNERWEFIGRGSRSDDEEETAQSGPEDSTEMPLKKRSKIKPDEQSKQKKVQASPKKGGGGSSSKSKATITPKSRSGSKSDSKSKDEKPAKSAVKSEDQTPKSGGSSKSTIISFKSPSKSKNSESQTPKGSTKSNEESTTKSKGTTTSPKPQGKSSTKTTASKDKSGHGSAKPNGTGKSKSGSSSSKAKELEKIAEEVEEHDDEETGSDELKEKSKGGELVKSGKKRRRSVKG